ncbi:MAG TPA: class I SAM-dependent methyltransferase [Nitrososphaeraceae archaeon]|jgi:SAM-dependent methyltransferase|nr:class I SAM-dependent methyltransferase [Nitrososphaeraceae archaeon]
MSSRRWNRAQEAEKRYWCSIRESWLNDDRRLYWQEILNRGFDLNYNFFLNKDVLEIGCGPSGIIFQIDTAKYRIGIEPMDLCNLVDEDWKKTIVKKGVGEELPFEDNSFDIVISFNALDHAINPEGVIRETHRVLRDNGDFLLWIYTLRGPYRPLQRILNRLDPPHPHHFTFNEIISKVSNNSFRINNRRYERGTGLKNDTIKKLFGNLMMNTAWIWSKKV